LNRIRCLAGLVSIFFFLPVQASQLLVGAVDEGSKCPKGEAPAARPLFAKTSEGWVSIDTPEKGAGYQLNEIHWTIAFDGRDFGHITSVAPKKDVTYPWAFSRDYRQSIKSNEKMKLVLNRKQEFGGWCNIPKYRPMVLVSQPNFKDPDKWKPFKPDSGAEHSIFEAFKKAVDRHELCNLREGVTAPPHMKFDRALANIRFYKSYKSGSGKKLIQVSMMLPYADCWENTGEREERAWFFIDREPVYLGTSMELLDAGDYDNDGHSEIIFWHSGYNEDGYMIVSVNPYKVSKFFWNYH